jgi:hypothetical protein
MPVALYFSCSPNTVARTQHNENVSRMSGATPLLRSFGSTDANQTVRVNLARANDPQGRIVTRLNDDVSSISLLMSILHRTLQM